MPHVTTQSTQTDEGSPIDESLMDQGVRLNDDDHETRIAEREAYRPTPAAGTWLFEDFMGANINSIAYDGSGNREGWGQNNWKERKVASTDSSVTKGTSDNAHPGVICLNAGTHVNHYGVTLFNEMVMSGNGQITAEWLIKINDLATVAEDYYLWFGFGDSAAGVLPTNGAYIKYDRSASVYWICGAINNSTPTNETTAVTVAEDTWVKLKIVINAAGTSIGFYINDELKETITTNLPEPGVDSLAPGMGIKKTNGTTSRTAECDYYWHSIVFTTAR